MNSWFILNKVHNQVVVELNEDIGAWGVTANDFINSVNELAPEDVHMNISSLGGDLTHALTIYDFLKTFKGNVTARFTGPSASAATIIAMAADRLESSENTPILVHNPWTMAVGDSGELRKVANDLDKFQNSIVNIYKKKTGQRVDAIKKLMNEDRWMDAKEAKQFGLIDKIVEPEKVENSISQVIMNKVRDKNFPDIPDKFQNIKPIKMENTEETQEVQEEKTANSIADKILAKLGYTKKEEVKAEIKEEEVEEIINKTADTFKPVIEEKEAEIENLNNSLSEKDQEMADLRAKIAKFEAKETIVPANEDNIADEKKKEPKFSGLVNWEVNKIKNRLGLN